MNAMRAHVQNGQIVLDERASLESSIADSESLAEFARGELVDARSVAEHLAAKP